MARKQKEYHFIYKTTNLLSGRYYIGMHSTDNLEDGYLGSGTRLSRAIKKHGKHNFSREILEFCGSREELKNREKDIVNLDEISKEECMNLQVGGGFSSEEHMIRYYAAGNILANLKKAFLRENDEIWREKESIRHSNIMKEAWIKTPEKMKNWGKDNRHTEKTKEKISNAMKGRGIGEDNSQYGTCWITNGYISKKINKLDFINFETNGWVLGRKHK